MSQKTSKMEALKKLLAVKATTVLKRIPSLLLSGEYVHVNIFFPFLLSVSEMTKAATRDTL